MKENKLCDTYFVQHGQFEMINWLMQIPNMHWVDFVDVSCQKCANLFTR